MTASKRFGHSVIGSASKGPRSGFVGSGTTLRHTGSLFRYRTLLLTIKLHSFVEKNRLCLHLSKQYTNGIAQVVVEAFGGRMA